MHSTTIEDDNVPGGRAGVDFYFIGDEEGETFKATVEYEPYFLVAVKRGREPEVEEWCRRAFEGLVKRIKRVEKEDLQMVRNKCCRDRVAWNTDDEDSQIILLVTGGRF